MSQMKACKDCGPEHGRAFVGSTSLGADVFLIQDFERRPVRRGRKSRANRSFAAFICDICGLPGPRPPIRRVHEKGSHAGGRASRRGWSKELRTTAVPSDCFNAVPVSCWATCSSGLKGGIRGNRQCSGCGCKCSYSQIQSLDHLPFGGRVPAVACSGAGHFDLGLPAAAADGFLPRFVSGARCCWPALPFGLCRAAFAEACPCGRNSQRFVRLGGRFTAGSARG